MMLRNHLQRHAGDHTEGWQPHTGRLPIPSQDNSMSTMFSSGYKRHGADDLRFVLETEDSTVVCSSWERDH